MKNVLTDPTEIIVQILTPITIMELRTFLYIQEPPKLWYENICDNSLFYSVQYCVHVLEKGISKSKPRSLELFFRYHLKLDGECLLT